MTNPIRRVGFASVSYELGLTTNRTFRLDNLSPQRFAETVRQNLDSCEAILSWMMPRGLRLFRLGSSFIPFAAHPAMDIDWIDLFQEKLAQIGRTYAAAGFRFSMHPGQYTLLNSPNDQVREQSVAELKYAAQVLDLMELDRSHKVVIHAGGSYGDKRQSSRRLIELIEELDESIRDRLALENDERQYSFADIVPICEQVGLPALFDLQHHELNPCDNIRGLLEQARPTWDSTPKVRVSSQRKSGRPGAHDLFVDDDDLAKLCDLLPFEADLMVEAKSKEVAALKVLRWLQARYPAAACA
jgi:UV DNA damage endonuclease